MPSESNRPRRIAGLIQRAVAEVLAREVKDPRVGLVTITGVKMSRDLASAVVYFTCLDEHADIRAVTRALADVTGFVRHALWDHLDLRGVPRLRFEYDESVARGQRIEALLRRDGPPPESDLSDS